MSWKNTSRGFSRTTSTATMKTSSQSSGFTKSRTFCLCYKKSFPSSVTGASKHLTAGSVEASSSTRLTEAEVRRRLQGDTTTIATKAALVRVSINTPRRYAHRPAVTRTNELLVRAGHKMCQRRSKRMKIKAK